MMEKYKYDVANILNGSQYRDEFFVGPSFFEDLREKRLVIVYAASDDLVEFEGAVVDEDYEGRKIFFNSNGIVRNECPEGDDCPNYQNICKYFVKGVFGKEGAVANWTFETNIPNRVYFMIKEDSDNFCHGFVFSLRDLV